MNKEKILEMIRPFVKDNQLTYAEFDEIFYMLSQKEKYLVAEFLTDDLKIFLVDERDFFEREDFQFVDYVLEEVKPYLDENQLTYDEFDEIFSDLDKRKQYAAANILDESNISLVDEKTFQTAQIVDDFPNNFPPQPEIIIPRQAHEIKASNAVLLRLAQRGDKQALRDLFVKNQALVCKYATRFSESYSHRLSIEDLKQAGMIGMLTAVERFDFEHDTQFSTYAVWWINNAIFRTISDEGFIIRLPNHIFEKIIKARRLDNGFYLEGKENFSERVELIAKEMKISAAAVRNLFNLRDKYLNVTSLDDPTAEDSETELKDFVEDKVTPEPFDIVAEKILKEKLADMLNNLTEREREVLILRFGFYGGGEYTLEEIGKYFGLTRERIRQIESKALKKLRQSSRIKNLKEFLD